jgi:hypothetical protein
MLNTYTVTFRVGLHNVSVSFQAIPPLPSWAGWLALRTEAHYAILKAEHAYDHATVFDAGGKHIGEFYRMDLDKQLETR